MPPQYHVLTEKKAQRVMAQQRITLDNRMLHNNPDHSLSI